MIVFLNGRFVAEDEAKVSVFDRGFLYGDGLFETILVRGGRPFRWQQHVERLSLGASCLGMKLPLSGADLETAARRLIRENGMHHAALRLTLTRGVGPRGYSPRGASTPSLAISLHPLPPIQPGQPAQWRLSTSSVRIPVGNALSAFKHCNRLAQILARAEADAAGADDALMLNAGGEAVETAGGNLFWVEGGAVWTPPLVSGILPGVARATLLQLCPDLGLSLQEGSSTIDALVRAEGVFVSASTFGLAEVTAIDARSLGLSPWTTRLHLAWCALLERSTLASAGQGEG